VKTQIDPQPTAGELVAIVSAIEALWPRPVVSIESQNPLRVPTWRFSSRWWATPSPARRSRPFR
jgi:hypothetical protein